MSSLPASVLIANRGEIAVRVIRCAAELGIRSVAVAPPDDADSLHMRLADVAVVLPGTGVAAYLDIDAVIDAARHSGATAVHPGYGFLAENAAFARACEVAGLVFIGPTPEVLDLFGDKALARAVAAAAGVPVLAGTAGPVDEDGAAAFLAEHGTMMLKAVAGGGGRGIRAVTTQSELVDALAACRREALAAFGDDRVYGERLVSRARHIEVQVIGDGTGAVTQLGERECSIQRRHQKLVEIAPAPGLPIALRDRIRAAAVQIATTSGYRNIGTFEFLVDSAAELGDDTSFFFIEANPRIQVEHTVTEEVSGVDLVETQFRLAAGATLHDLGLELAAGAQPELAGFAIQLRINAERLLDDGSTVPTGGILTRVDLPAGRGVRVDTHAQAGTVVGARYDSLLAKLIVHRRSGGFESVVAKAAAALAETRIDGIETNLAMLTNIVGLADFSAANLHTGFIAEHLKALRVDAPARSGDMSGGVASLQAGASVDRIDPLAVLAYGKASGPAVGSTSSSPEQAPLVASGPAGTVAVLTPLQGTVAAIGTAVGDTVHVGQVVAVMESMKMEHEIRSTVSGIVRLVAAEVGAALWADQPMLFVEEADVGEGLVGSDDVVDLDEIRPGIAEVIERHALTTDARRPDAVARRRGTDQRTARENVEALVDPATFVEYGPLALAAQRRRRGLEDLIVRSPADGLIIGVGSVNGDLFDDPVNRCAVMVYDYTVFAGTQGIRNHAKTDKIIDVATEGRLPFILFAEGGGGRPGDTDGGDFGSRTFSRFATMSGLVPMVGVTSGYCFAGNASLLGCCDVIIATRNSNIGMGGPAMIEGGGLGVFRPDEIGPLEVQVASGVVDVVVEDEVEAAIEAKRYLSYFQGRTTSWESHDQRLMRPIVPENRLRVYEVRRVIETLADVGTMMELRRGFGLGMVTALIRIEGRPVGVIANDPMHLGGAIDSDGADKAARFLQLCDAFDLPVVQFCDTPGIMVGPEIEKTALVRHSSRLFLVGANIDVPMFTVILRKAYGLGGIAMAGGSFKKPMFSVAWPTAEFGGMGLEGFVKLGFRDILAAIEDPDERLAKYEELVAKEYRRGGALNYATGFAVDDTIDPADTRFWLANLLASVRPPAPRNGKKRSSIDSW